MAHFKRGKCRYQSSPHSSETFYRKRLGLKPTKLPYRWYLSDDFRERDRRQKIWPPEFWSMGNWPRWHDIINHTRPRRARDKALARLVLLGHVSADEALWELDKKPHIWYW